jgi:hypothetical protein
LKRFLKLAAILGFVATITTGCAVNRATGSVDPSTNLSALKTMYVKKIPAEDGGTNELIADKLRSENRFRPGDREFFPHITDPAIAKRNGQ